MRREILKLLILQALLASVAALVMYGIRGQPGAAGAALYGGGIAVVNALLLARRTARAAATADADPRWSGFGLMAGMLERFVFTLVAFGLGIGLWRLDPPSLIIGFAAPQLGFMLVRGR